MSKNQMDGPLYLKVNSTVFEVLYGSSNLALSGAPTAVTTTDLSTALTGTTVLTAAVALASEVNKTNAIVMEIKTALIAFGLLST